MLSVLCIAEEHGFKSIIIYIYKSVITGFCCHLEIFPNKMNLRLIIRTPRLNNEVNEKVIYSVIIVMLYSDEIFLNIRDTGCQIFNYTSNLYIQHVNQLRTNLSGVPVPYQECGKNSVPPTKNDLNKPR